MHSGMRITTIDLKATVLNLSCTLETPGELFQSPDAQAVRPITQESPLQDGINIFQTFLDDINIDVKPRLRITAFSP